MLAPLILVGTAFFIFIFGRFFPQRLAQTISLGALAIAFFSFFLDRFSWHPWAGTEFLGGQPTFSLQGWGLAFALPLTVFLFFALGLHSSRQDLDAHTLSRGLLLGGLGLLFLAAQDAVALLFSWGLLDLGIFATLLTSPRATLEKILRAGRWSLLGIFGWLVFALVGLSSPFVLVALWIRLSLYPAHALWDVADEFSGFLGSALRAIIIAAGGYLWTRNPAIGLAEAGQGIAAIFSLLAILFGLFFLWNEERSHRMGLYIYQMQIGFLMFTHVLGIPALPAVVLLTSLGLVFAWEVFLTAQNFLPAEGGRRKQALVWAPVIIALATWTGVPLTLGFAARILHYGQLLYQGQKGVLLLAVLLTLLTMPPFLRLAIGFVSRKASPIPPSPPRLSMWPWLLSAPLLVLGVYPPLVLNLARTPIPWESIILLIPSWVAIILPLVGGYLVWRRKPLFKPPSLGFLDGEGFYRFLGWVDERAGRALRALASLGEGRGALGWYLLFALIFFLWISGG